MWSNLRFTPLFDAPNPWKTPPNPDNLFKTIEENLHQPWDWRAISRHPEMDWAFLDRNINHSWDWEYLASRAPIWLLLKNPDKDWGIWSLSKLLVEKHLLGLDDPVSIIRSFPDYQWEWDYLSIYMPLEVMNAVKDLLPWQYDLLDLHRENEDASKTTDFIANATPQWIESRILEGKSLNYNVLQPTRELIEKYPDKPWVAHRIFSGRDALSMDWDLISKTPHLDWDWNALQERKGFPLDFIVEFPDKPWTINNLKVSHSKDWKLVACYPHLDWNWRALSLNQKVPWPIILAYLDKPWDWYYLSRRLSKEGRYDIVSLPHLRDKIYWKSIRPTRDAVKKYFWLPWKKMRHEVNVEAATVIQRWWRNVGFCFTGPTCILR
jgi:hypothetical protein